MPSFTKTKITFDSKGATCAGYLYFPEEAASAVPCVVMANGFSGTMDWILPDFAERFAAAGLGVLTFDYRHLGESEGAPRQIVNVRRQRRDLKRAVQFARSHAGIDPERIALWGTSLGGSHAAVHASRDGRIAAVILNMPALDVVKGSNLQEKLRRMNVSRMEMLSASIRLLGAAARDAIQGALGLPPHYIAVYGQPGEAFFADPALADRFAKVTAGSPTWENRVAPRFLFQAPRYREGMMERITAPLLICLATEDDEISASFVKEKARKAHRAEIREYAAGHFDMYHGAIFEQVAADQTRFLREHLLEGRS
jgi:uncharacterized protein